MKKRRIRWLFSILILSILCRAPVCQVYLQSADDAVGMAFSQARDYDLQWELLVEGIRLSKKDIMGFLPIIDFSWSESSSVNKGEADFRNKKIGFGITQKLFDGGKTVLQYKMGKSKSLFDFYQFLEEYEAFGTRVMEAYYKALLSSAKIDVQKEAVENARLLLKAAAVQLEEEMIVETEFVEVSLAFNQMEVELKNYIDQAESARRELCRLMGRPWQEKVFFEEKRLLSGDFVFLEKGLLAKEKDSLIEGALKKSVALKKIQAEIDWMKKERAIQKGIFIPSLSVNGSVDFNGKDYPLTRPSYSLKFIVGFEKNPWVSAKANVGGVFKNEDVSQKKFFPPAQVEDGTSGSAVFNTTYFGQLRMGKIQLEQKALSREKLTSQIENSVLDLAERIDSVCESLFLNYDTLKLMERKIEFFSIKLDEGEITRTDFLEELNKLSKQKIQVFSLRNDYNYLLKQMETLTGIKISYGRWGENNEG